MALARIISNSPLCSRELAINLLARGYAVEIVSPDAIPDNIADLEVRVETGPADLLSASVEARGKTHSSTLQFIHQLKSPSLDMKRPAPVALQEEALCDVTIPALAIPANPLPAIEPLEPIPDVCLPVLAMPANPLPTVEPFEPISEATLPALKISANPLATATAREAIPVSTSALAHVITPVVADEPAEMVTPANAAADAGSVDPPKKRSAFSEVKSLILLPGRSQEVAGKIEEQEKMELPPAPPVFRVVIPKPDLRRIRIPRFDVRNLEGVLSRSMDWFRNAGLVIPKPDLRGIRIPTFDLGKWEGLFSRSMKRVRSAAVRPPRWFGWMALGLVGVMALGLALELASRQTKRNPGPLSSSVAPAGNSAAVNNSSSVPPANEGQSTAGAKSSTLSQPSEAKPSAGRASPPVRESDSIHSSASTKPPASPPAKRAKVARKAKVVHHSDDDVAPNTITYFNRPGAKAIQIPPTRSP
jgi:hypothetical protein